MNFNIPNILKMAQCIENYNLNNIGMYQVFINNITYNKITKFVRG